MPDNTEKFLELAAFMKVINNEPLSLADGLRVMNVLRDRPPQLDAPQEKAAPFISQFKEMLHRVYLS